MPPVPASTDDIAITRADGGEASDGHIPDADDDTLPTNANHLHQNESPTVLYIHEVGDGEDTADDDIDRHFENEYNDVNDHSDGDDDNDNGGDDAGGPVTEIGDPMMVVATLSDSDRTDNDEVCFHPTLVELNRNGVVRVTLKAEVTGSQSASLRLLRRDATRALRSLKVQDSRGGKPQITFTTPPPMAGSNSSPSSSYPMSKYRNEPPWCALLAGNAGAMVSLTSVNGDELSGTLLGVEPPSRARGGDGFVFLEDETGAAVAVRPLDTAPVRIKPNCNQSTATAAVTATLPHAAADADPYFTIHVRGCNDAISGNTNDEDGVDMSHGTLSITYSSVSEHIPAFDIVHTINLSRDNVDDGLEEHAKLSSSVIVPNPTPFPLRNVDLVLITGDALEADNVDKGGSGTTMVMRVPGADLGSWSSSESSCTSRTRSFLSSSTDSSSSTSSTSTPPAPNSHNDKCALDDNELEIPLTRPRRNIDAKRPPPPRRRIMFPPTFFVDVNQSTVLPFNEDVECTVGLTHSIELKCNSNTEQTAERTLLLRNTTGTPLEAGVGCVIFLDGQMRRFKMPFLHVGGEALFTLSFESAVTVTNRASTRVADVVSCTMRVDRLVTCVEWIHHIRFDIFNAGSRPVDVVVHVHLAKTEGFDSDGIGSSAIVAYTYDNPRDVGRESSRTRLPEIDTPCRSRSSPQYHVRVRAGRVLAGTIDEKAVREHTFDIRSNVVSPRLIAQLSRLDGVPEDVPNRLRRLVRERQALKALRRTRRRHRKKLGWFAGFVEGKMDDYWAPESETVNGQHFLDRELDRYVTLSENSERCVARLRERINELDERIVAAEHDVRDVVDQLTRLLTDEALLIVDEGHAVSGTTSNAAPVHSANNETP